MLRFLKRFKKHDTPDIQEYTLTQEGKMPFYEIKDTGGLNTNAEYPFHFFIAGKGFCYMESSCEDSAKDLCLKYDAPIFILELKGVALPTTKRVVEGESKTITRAEIVRFTGCILSAEDFV